MSRRFPIFAALLALSAAAIGCAAEADLPPDATEDDDLTAKQLPGVVAIEIQEVRAQDEVLSSMTVGAPKKVKAVVASVKRLRPTDPVPKCIMRDTLRLRFLGADGKPVATVGTYCGGFGGISFENGAAGYGVRLNGDAVDTAKSGPFAVGDALWGISRIELWKPGSSTKKSLTGDGTKAILAGFDLDAVPNPNASFPRCAPSHAVSFFRGNGTVATTSFLCGGGEAPASIQAHFVATKPGASAPTPPLARGGIQIDPRPVVEALRATP